MRDNEEDNMAQPRHSSSGRWKRADDGRASAGEPAGTSQPPSPGSATPGQTGGTFAPADPGGPRGDQAPHRLRPAAKSG